MRCAAEFAFLGPLMELSAHLGEAAVVGKREPLIKRVHHRQVSVGEHALPFAEAVWKKIHFRRLKGLELPETVDEAPVVVAVQPNQQVISAGGQPLTRCHRAEADDERNIGAAVL